MRNLLSATELLHHADAAEAFRSWLADGDSLVAACRLLGGPRWSRQAAAVVDSIRLGSAPVELLRDLLLFQKLLSLELADEPWSTEAALLAAIHPDDPRANDARLAAEALDRGIEAVSALARAGALHRRAA